MSQGLGAADSGNVFEQRAEYLSAEELLEWTKLSSKEEATVKKLMGSGAKLLVGPRGCGKSTLMRIAYFRLIESQESVPVYVNFARSLALEPYFHTRSDAIRIFRHWVIAKILVGLGKYFEDSGLSVPTRLQEGIEVSDRYVRQLEAGADSAPLPTEWGAPSSLVDSLESLCAEMRIPRVVLLLDDAAHAFSAEQQREFFEVFRELRTRAVCPKAAVYPGVTSYSPNFHVGHEAEVLEAWLGVDDPAYLSSMRSLLERRFPSSIREALADKPDLVDYLALASFGLPRGFINMLSELVGLEAEEGSANRPRVLAPKIVENYAQSVIKIYVSLGSKLPKLKNYVDAGTTARRKIIQWVKHHNLQTTSVLRRAYTVGIDEPVARNVERILHMMEYAGLIREAGSVSRGARSFRRYQVHFGLLISENALALGRSPSIKATNEALLTRDSQALVRLRSVSILSAQEQDACTLNLLPCSKCSTPRAFPEQRYCTSCGSELRDGSVYLELLNTPVEALPLPKAKIEGILSATSLRTVHDILMDDEAQQLRNVPRVGRVWSKRIRTAAEEFVSV